MKMRLLAPLGAAFALAVGVSSAVAAGPVAGSCSGSDDQPGVVVPGVYKGYTVTGTCFFAGGAVTIDGNLTVANGASLNAHAAVPASVHVTGNVLVGKGAVLGLGSYGGPTDTVVDGNIVASRPQSLYLAFVTIRGNLVSNGGSGPGLNFPLKNLVVGGNVVLQGWSGLWIGLFRSDVGGNVIFSKNSGNQIGDSGLPDSSEIADNTISGNLICHGNDPAAQIGDSEGGPNTVGGKAIGQCARLAG